MKKDNWILFLSILCASCTQAADDYSLLANTGGTRIEEPNTTLVVETYQSVEVDVTKRTATVYGSISCKDSTAVIKRGFLLSETEAEPRIGINGVRNIVASRGLGDFSKIISNVKAKSFYYLRAYGIWNTDTVYGNIVTFTQTGQLPRLETLPVELRVHRAAIVYARFTQPGDGVTKFGCCLGLQPNPTLDDETVTAADTCKQAGQTGEFGTFFDKLEEEVLYHVRAFAITPTDTVYGNERIFKTTPQGNLSWGFWSGEAEDAQKNGAYDRIKTAMDSAQYYYNHYSLLSKHMNVNYEPTVQTADCNIEGWLRFGPGATYQWVGTAEHEIAHAMGVGTASNWSALFDSNGRWTGINANRILRALMDDQTQFVKHSGIHFYPGGINYQSEVTSGGQTNSYGVTFRNERVLLMNAFILHGMREDGLTTY